MYIFFVCDSKSEIKNKTKKEVAWLVCKNRMRNCNLRVRLRVRKTSSIFVSARQFPVPYHSLTPPAHIRMHKLLFTSVQVPLKKRRKIKAKQLKERLQRVQRYSREWRKSLQKDVADKPSNKREL